jgi:SAM-dependent methyltransferase
MTETTAVYTPEFFDVGSISEAKNVILGPEENATVEQRWQRETPYLVDLIRQHLSITDESVLLDYGCGVGRLSRELIQQTGCRAIGVDQSVNMRALSANYVNSPNFYSCDASMLLPGSVDFALSVWVLQHCVEPYKNIEHIHTAMRPGGVLFVIEDKRLIPTNKGWITDEKDNFAFLREKFVQVDTIRLSNEKVGKDLAPRSRCGIFRKD